MVKRGDDPTGIIVAPRSAELGPALPSRRAPAPCVNPAVSWLSSLRSENTRTAARASLAALLKLVGGAGHSVTTFPWQALDYEHVRALHSTLLQRLVNGAYAPTTVNRHVWALRSVLREAWRLGYFDRDTLERIIDVKSVEIPECVKGRMLEQSEIQKLYQACSDGSPMHLRDAALFAIAVRGGLRRFELAALDLADFLKGAVTVQHGKGDKRSEVALPAGAVRRVEAWIAVRGNAPGPLLTNAYGHRLSSSGVAAVLAAMWRRAGVAPFSPHDLRRTYVSVLLEGVNDLLVVSRAARHKSVETTKKYDKRPKAVERARIVSALDKLDP